MEIKSRGVTPSAFRARASSAAVTDRFTSLEASALLCDAEVRRGTTVVCPLENGAG